MKKALIVGMARSGIASARLLYENGWRVLLCDSRPEIEGLEEALADIEYTSLLGEDPASHLDGVDWMVLSPGVPMDQPFIALARERNIDVLGEIELGYRFSRGEFFCITGTNGKTTSTMLAGEVLKQLPRRVFVLGNMGLPISQFAMQTQEGDAIVAETAALQLEGNSKFHAHVAAFTNIREDHMDRFKTMDYYTATKAKIFENQTPADYAVLNYDDPVVRSMAAETPAQVLYFSRLERPPQGVYLRDGEIVYDVGGASGAICRAESLRIPGVHNLENAMLCAAMGLAAGVLPEAIGEALVAFPGVEHRIEFVCERGGVRYINDSKGTNPDSTLMAVAAMDRPTVLLLGGYDKHSNFVEMFRAMRSGSRVKAAVILGETAPKLLDAAREAGFAPAVHAEKGFRDAVNIARGLAAPGDTVLLSPACASWDMFSDFEQRGRVFKEIVLEYPED